MLKRLMIGLLLSLSLLRLAHAQGETAYFRLLTSTMLQTGQYYDLIVRLDARDVWAFTLELAYDPQKIYIVGTQAGSPFQNIGALSEAEGAILINRVASDRVQFVYSRLAPANSANYAQDIIKLRLYPISPGPTTLKLSNAEASRVVFQGAGEQRTVTQVIPLKVAANELLLTISGEAVEPPLEATATPAPTVDVAPSTPPAVPLNRGTGGGVALLDAATPTPSLGLLTELPPVEGNLSLLLLALLVIGIGAAGLIGLFVWQRKR
jgi:hypothetical protein